MVYLLQNTMRSSISLNIQKEKNYFTEVLKNLAKYRFENNFVGPSKELHQRMLNNVAKSFDFLATSLSVT